MKKEEVVGLIGEGNWSLFLEFMYGQTVGVKDGEEDYYESDVKRFCRSIGK